MRRHIESYYLVLLAEILEGKRLIALVAIDNKQHVATYPSPLYLLNEVLQPGYTNLICSLAVVTNPNTLLGLQI